MQFASPADRSPIPQAEAPRDCPLCPRLVRFRHGMPRRASRTGGTRRCRRSAIRMRGWRSSASLPASMARTALGGRSPAITRASCSTRRCSSSGWRRANIAPIPADGLTLKGAVILNAVKCLPPANKPEPSEIATCRNYFEAALAALPKVRVLLALGQIAHVAAARALGLPPTTHQVRPWRRSSRAGRPHAALELPLLALQPEHAAARRRDVREPCSSARCSRLATKFVTTAQLIACFFQTLSSIA